MTSSKSSDSGLSKFHRLLVDQVRHEFTASHQYVALAAWFDTHDLPQLARVFYEQSLEERDHAMMLVRYLIDRDVDFALQGVDGIETEFAAPRDLVALALRQEREVSDQFQRLAKVARDEDDYTGEQFLQWFIQEQVEEIAKMSTLLNVVDRSNGNLFDVETFVARDMPSEDNGSQSAPATAGPAVS
ncbi:ferritin [Nocardiopsis changdeensis]|uniref:Ferritin n=1 Tax=Nocardiopsis changdeensis TaxID=2831969 RepID=A0ABX8BGQ0_9ACTN|nr:MULTISPECIES: ferritin [Nocardiopsis]QUX21249.1 ferritin [Nocardiopsis changdeensis]QYX37180.1 ferritin [Nocardiopsis sp. MT53]